MQHMQYRLSLGTQQNLIHRIANAKPQFIGGEIQASSRRKVNTPKNTKVNTAKRKVAFKSFTNEQTNDSTTKQEADRYRGTGDPIESKTGPNEVTANKPPTKLLKKHTATNNKREPANYCDKGLTKKRRTSEMHPSSPSDKTPTLGRENFTVKHMKQTSTNNNFLFKKKKMPDRTTNLSFKLPAYGASQKNLHAHIRTNTGLNERKSSNKPKPSVTKTQALATDLASDQLFKDMRKKFNITAVAVALQNMNPGREPRETSIPLKPPSEQAVPPKPKFSAKETSMVGGRKTIALKSEIDLYRKPNVRNDKSVPQQRTVLKSIRLEKVTLPINKEHEKAMNNIGHRYVDYELMGQGSFSCIYKAIDRVSRKPVAMKITKSKKNELEREFSLLRALAHPNIIKGVDLIEDISSGQSILIMEFGGPKNLKEYQITLENKVIPEPLAIRLVERIIDALGHMHANHIAHCDIKVENIGIDQNSPWLVKLLDFGFADVFKEKVDSFFCGTTAYMSPQLLAHRPFCPFKADVWALGVLIYKLVFYMFPFKGKSDDDVLSRIKLGNVNFPSNIRCSAGLRGLLKLCFTIDESKRPSMTQVKEYFISNVLIND